MYYIAYPILIVLLRAINSLTPDQQQQVIKWLQTIPPDKQQRAFTWFIDTILPNIETYSDGIFILSRLIFERL